MYEEAKNSNHGGKEAFPVGEITAEEAFREALLNLKSVCLHIKSTFKEAVEKKHGEEDDGNDDAMET